jgi:hypothetical protein
MSLSLAVACRLSTELGPIAWLTLSSTAGAAAWVRVEEGRVVEEELVDGQEAYLEAAAGWLGDLFDCEEPIELWDSLADALEGIEDVPWGAVGRDSEAYDRRSL